MQAANDNKATTFGRMPDSLDELDSIHAWLLVELAEDDVDHLPLMLDARLVRGRIDQLRPPVRPAPRLTVVH